MMLYLVLLIVLEYYVFLYDKLPTKIENYLQKIDNETTKKQTVLLNNLEKFTTSQIAKIKNNTKNNNKNTYSISKKIIHIFIALFGIFGILNILGLILILKN